MRDLRKALNVATFIGCDTPYEEAETVLFGAPFDGTTSFRPGTRFGPSAMRNESFGIEVWSMYQQKDLSALGVCDVGDLEFPFGSSERVLDLIEAQTAAILADGKRPCMLGGEHLVTLGAVRACGKKYPELSIIHLDAHADLLDNYLGEELSHGAVIRRCHEILGDGRIFQFGIRSGDSREFQWAKGRVDTHPFDLEGMDKLAETLKGKPVYLTLDLDVLDPSIFPGTGTPEAGGVTFKELLKGLLSLKGLNIVGLDINELSPAYDTSGVSTAVACKVLRELLMLVSG